MNSVDKLDLEGLNVLIRVDFNVPIEGRRVFDNYRIKESIPTIKYCLDNGAAVILMSHLGRPTNNTDMKFSLEPVFFELEKLVDNEIFFSDDCISKSAINFSNELMPGEIHLLENLRFYKDEQENSNKFAEKLSEHADVYINDAFGVSHRQHSSNFAILKYFNKEDIAYGRLIEKELKNLNAIIDKPQKPFTVIMGGAKIDDKIPMIERILEKADNIIIGGKMAFAFLKASNMNVGAVKVEDKLEKLSNNIIEKAKKNNINIILPKDFVCIRDLNNYENWDIKNVESLNENDFGFDIGPESSFEFGNIIKASKSILWNGPMGVFEKKQFATGTDSIATDVGYVREKGGQVVAGGGDTASAVNSIDLNHNFNHISTGGGASLEVLSGKKLKSLEV